MKIDNLIVIASVDGLIVLYKTNQLDFCVLFWWCYKEANVSFLWVTIMIGDLVAIHHA